MSKSKQVHYTDGTPSREIEDWEATGAEEMNELHAKIKNRTTAVSVRDRLINLKDLIAVCREALNKSGAGDNETVVANVLYFYVEDQLTIAEKELQKI